MAASSLVVRTGWRAFWERAKEVGGHLASHYAEEYYKKWISGEADPPPRHAIPFYSVPDDVLEPLFAARPHRLFRLADGTTRPGFLIFLGRVEAPSFDVDHVPIPDGFWHPSQGFLFADRAPRLGPVLRCRDAPLPPPPVPKPTPVVPTPTPQTPTPTAPPADTDSSDYVKWAKCAGLIVIGLGLLGLGVYLHKANAARRERERLEAEEEERRRRGELDADFRQLADRSPSDA